MSKNRVLELAHMSLAIAAGWAAIGLLLTGIIVTGGILACISSVLFVTLGVSKRRLRSQ